MTKSILITGCSTGFGFEGAKYLAGKGHTVYATNGQRPLRTIAGLDFGSQALNDAVEPIRHSILQGMEIAHLDGPASK